VFCVETVWDTSRPRYYLVPINCPRTSCSPRLMRCFDLFGLLAIQKYRDMKGICLTLWLVWCNGKTNIKFANVFRDLDN